MRSIEAGAASIRAGNSFLIFPGRHAQPDRRAAAVQEGRLHHGDQGAGADRAGGHPGGRAAMQRGSAIIRPVTVSIRVGEPIETAGMSTSTTATRSSPTSGNE